MTDQTSAAPTEPFSHDWDFTAQDRNGNIKPKVRERCVACNKPLEDPKIWVAVDWLNVVPLAGSGERDPIGPDCAKRIPAGYLAVSPVV
jgi:hypothetical protein